jgi:hypothetical protein
VIRFLQMKWLIVLILSTAAIALLLHTRHPSVSIITALFAIGVIFLGLLPATQWARTPRSERPRFPLMALAGIYYSIFYGVAVFLIGVMWNKEKGRLVFYSLPGDVRIDDKSMIAAFCSVLFLIGAYNFSSRWLAPKLPALRIVNDPNWPAIRILIWVLMIGFVAYLYLPALSKYPSLGSFIITSGTVSISVFFMLWRTNKLPPYEAAALMFVALPLVLIKMGSSGFLTPLMLLVTLLISLEIWLGKKTPWKAIIILPLFFILIYPVAFHVRNKIWNPSVNLAATEKIALSTKIVLNFYGFQLGKTGVDYGFSPFSKTSYGGAVTRISHELILSQVIQKTPHEIPFWGGNTYKPLLTKLIPRAVWAGKPTEKVGNTFGRRYGFLPPTEYGMSLNLPWMPELFANFGWMGLILGMPVIGFLMYIFEGFFVSHRTGYLEGAIGAAIVTPLFYHESNFSLVVGNIPLITLFIWLFIRIGHWALTEKSLPLRR